MNNKQALEKYKQELAELEIKQRQQNEDNKSTKNNTEEKKNILDEIEDGYFQRPHMQKLYRVIMRVFVVLFGLMMLQAFIPIPFIAFLFNPASYKLPYNGIDFKKIAYINNQFIMYGVDYDEPKEPSLAIFNSIDGKSWTRSQITYHGKKEQIPISYHGETSSGTFIYFKGHCYLFGVKDDPLMADRDCNDWHDYQVMPLKSSDLVFNGITSSNPERLKYLMEQESYRQKNYLTTAHDSVVVKDSIYVSTEQGLYSSQDGVSWVNESLPCLKEWNNLNCTMQNVFFGSIAYGNNKVLVSYPSKSLIYTKNLTSNQWSYESFPSAVTSLVYGKDRFVGLSATKAWALINNHWEDSSIKTDSSELTYGLNSTFVGTNIVNISQNGKQWQSLNPTYEGDDHYNPFHLACNKEMCIAVGYHYKIAISYDGYRWVTTQFNLRNSKLSWYRRFLTNF